MGLGSFFGRSLGTIAGVKTIRTGGQLIKGIGDSLRTALCPKCRNGRMRLLLEQGSSDQIKMCMCDRCGYIQPLQGPGEAELAELHDDALYQIGLLSDDDYRNIVRGHLISSRIFFGMALAILFYAFYILFFTNYPGLLVPVSGFGVLFVSLGIKSSYRYWQISTRTIFEKGAFQRWFKQGRWIV